MDLSVSYLNVFGLFLSIRMLNLSLTPSIMEESSGLASACVRRVKEPRAEHPTEALYHTKQTVPSRHSQLPV
eukprot:5674151-Amphidinium_carterae.1